MVRRTSSECSALEFSAAKIGTATAGLLSSSERAVLGGAELDAGDVAQAGDRAAGLGLDDDVAELFLGLEASCALTES